MIQDHKFVFISGLHKSGTSIVFKCLREHPSISGFSDTGVPQDEGQHLQSVYHPAGFYGGMGEFGFHPEAHLAETSPLVTEENRLRLFSEWQRYWDTQRPFLLEKSPPNLIRTRFLQAMFPNSFFIVITRHPIAVSFAVRKHWRIKFKLDSLLRHWLFCHEIFSSDKIHLRNVLVFKYEDFVEAPADYLERIYSFLGIDSFASSLQIRSDINAKYLQRWRDFQDNIFLRIYANYAIAKYEKRVNRYGYSLMVQSRDED